MNPATLHPLIVHAPLVLLPIAIVFELLSLAFPKSGLRIAAILLLLGGVGGAILATATGEAAEHRSERISENVEDIRVPDSVAQAIADGQLLETHAQLGEMTRNLYALLLLIEAGLFFATSPALARFRGNFTLSASVERLARGVWLIVGVAGIALVVLTGHYGGTMVYDYGIGIQPQTIAPSTSDSTPSQSVAPDSADDKNDNDSD